MCTLGNSNSTSTKITVTLGVDFGDFGAEVTWITPVTVSNYPRAIRDCTNKLVEDMGETFEVLKSVLGQTFAETTVACTLQSLVCGGVCRHST